jgi:hypothetical protein
MKKALVTFLQVVIVLIGIAVFIFMLWEPHFEGRNVGATVSEIYFNDPFLVYAYTASIAFFIGLYQAFKLLGYVGKNTLLSPHSLKALRTIKHCAMTILAFVVGAEAYLFIAQPGDDIAGGVFMGLLLIAASGIVASAAARFEKTLEKVVGPNLQ